MKNLIKTLLIMLTITSCDYCDYFDKFRNGEIKGIVTEKRKHEWNKNEKAILFNNSASSIDNIFLMPGSKSTIWEYAEVGDSIFKESNSTVVILERKGKLKEFNIIVNCP